jgi:copper-binding protein NosD
MKTAFKLFAAAIISVGLAPGRIVLAQGSLTPPGAPAPTMKTLSQVEPRIPILSLPFAITTGGSYYLTTNLVGIASNAGISIQTNDVTIDLNGFAVIGVPGSLDGIRVVGALKNITVRNGTVRGWGLSGVSLASCRNSRLESMTVSENGSYGMVCGHGSIITGSLAYSNGGYGIACNPGSVVRDCTALSNSLSGIIVSESSVSDCTSKGNVQSGIDSAARSYIYNNHCLYNAVGIRIGSGSVANRVDGNHVIANGYGIHTAVFPNLVIRNSASDNVTNYFLQTSVTYGPTNSVSGVITNQNPWINFSFP